jgi:phage tail-like protein
MGVIPVFPGNPRQKHQFIVRVDGFESAWFEKAQIPEVETEIDEFNPAGSVRSTKFAGRGKIGDATLEKGVMADSADLAGWKWLVSAVNTETGDLGDPKLYKKDIEIVHINRVGIPMQTWTLKGTFCKKVAMAGNEGGSSDHMIETLTLSVDDVTNT